MKNKLINALFLLAGEIGITYFSFKMAYAIYTFKQEGLESVLNAFNASVKNEPWKLDISNVMYQKFWLSCTMLYVITLLAIYASQRNYMRGQEHGTARWATNSEVKAMRDRNIDNNILLSSTVSLSMNTRKTQRNNNVLVVGAPGRYKSRGFVRPNIMQLHSSFVVTDPKGELYYDTKTMLQNNGYDVKVLNLVDMQNSNSYNPFHYVKKDEDVLEMINCFMRNTRPKEINSTGDPFWEDAEKALLMAVCFYIWHELPVSERNFATLAKMIVKGEEKEEDYQRVQTELDGIFEDLAVQKPNHIAVQQYKMYKLANSKTAQGVLITASSRLAPFNISAIAGITESDDMEVEKMGYTKSALFVIIPDSHGTFNFLASMLYTQMFSTLYREASTQPQGRLPVHVRFILDEFANIGQIPDFDKKIATMRGREISVSIIIQDFSQIENLYKTTWKAIRGCCDTLLFLGTDEQTTLDDISRRLGKKTIDTRNSSYSKGGRGGYNIQFGILGRELMTADEIRTMPMQDCIILIAGLKPIRSRKYQLEKHKRYKELVGN